MGDKQGWINNLASVDLRGPGVGKQFIKGDKGWRYGKAGPVTVRFYVGSMSPGKMTEPGCWTFAELRSMLKTFKAQGPGAYGSYRRLHGFLKRCGQLPKARAPKAEKPELELVEAAPAPRPAGTTTILRKARRAVAAK